MALHDQEAAQIQSYLNQWDEIFDDVFYRPVLGTASINETEELLNSIRSKLNTLVKHRNDISRELLAKIDSKTTKLISYVQQIKELDDGFFVSDRSSIIKTIEEFHDGVLEWWPSIAAVSNFSSSSEEYLSQIKDAVENVQKNAKKGEEDAESIEDLKTKLEFELENFENRFKDLMTSGEFLAQQDIFKNESDDHSKKAVRWFFGIIVSTIILLLVLFYVVKSFCFSLECFQNEELFAYNSLCENCSNQIIWFEIIKSILFRVLLISISIYLLSFSIKNYNSHMHNKTVNAHKKNSFAAAISLLNRAETQEGKDKLISLAAQSIFTHIKTGYLSKEEAIANPLMMDKFIDKLK